MDTVGLVALAACWRGLAAGGCHPSSWHRRDLGGWQLCVTVVVNGSQHGTVHHLHGQSLDSRSHHPQLNQEQYLQARSP